MKKSNILHVIIMFFICACLRAAAPSADVYDPSLYGFGEMGNSGTTLCCHGTMKDLCLQDLSPLDTEGRWYFKIRYKEKPKEVRDVIGLIEYTKDIDGIKHYFYGVPLENKGNLIRFAADAAYIRNLKFPVFSFIFLDVELSPPIKYVKFPMASGEEWDENSTGLIDILGLFKVKMKTTAKFRVKAIEDVPVDGRYLHVYKVENFIERGDDGKIFREENWFGAGVGLMYSDTEAYTLELKKYAPGPGNRKRFLELTEPAVKR